MAMAMPPAMPCDAAQIDVVAASSALDDIPIDSDAFANRDYVARRRMLWDDLHAAETWHAIARLPLPLQVAFRRKMFTILAMQIALIGAIVGLLEFHPAIAQWASRSLAPISVIVAVWSACVVCLVVLYVLRNVFPLNWGLLLVFTVLQAMGFVSAGVLLHSKIGLFNCIFMLLCVLLMIPLSSVRRRSRHSGPSGELLSSLAAGVIAYVVVGSMTTVLYFAYGHAMTTPTSFAFSMGFQAVLLLWFSLDASAMYRVMSPDEYMHGVIYLYTDLIVLAAICAIVVGVITLANSSSSDNDCPNCSGDCLGDCECNDCGCHDCVCTDCYCPNCWFPDCWFYSSRPYTYDTYTAVPRARPQQAYDVEANEHLLARERHESTQHPDARSAHPGGPQGKQAPSAPPEELLERDAHAIAISPREQWPRKQLE